MSGTPGGNSTLPTLTPAQITALDTYVAAPDSSYSFSLNSTLTGTGYTDYVINMVSQTWTPSPGDSQVWQHWVQIIVPTTVSTHTAVLNISGGTNSSTAPTSPDAQSLATATTLNAITVFLPTVPNEPVTFPAQGETTPLTEDQIVAYTFEQFLDGNGQDWPLLLPMVKSAVRAMDTTQSFVSSQSGGTLSVDNFIVTGASKRGWTTWLTPAVDTRVVAIVPYVFDGLNLADQVESQLDTYVGVTQDTVNGDSTAVQDYTGDGVFNFFGTPQMSSLLSIVDPYAYIGRSTYNIPKYLIDSTGDQFFVPGAQFYFSNLPGENYLRYIPNTDHSLDTDAVIGGIDFEKALLDGASLPQFTWNVSNSGTTITLNSATTPSSVTMWQATNTTNRDFRLETFGANWTSSTLTDQGGGTYVAQVTPPSTGATDFFIQMQYTVDGMTLTFTTQISTVPLLTPAVTVTDNTGSYDGNPFAATATATGRAGLPVPGTFSFDYYNGPNPIGTPFTTPPTQFGTYTVVASFASSDPDYAGASSQPLTFQILKDTPVLTLTDAGGPYSDTPYPATATIAGVVTGVDDTPGVSLEGVPVTIEYFANGSTTPLSGAPTTAGAYNAIASFNGSQDYFGTAKQIFFQIAHDTPILTVSDAGGPYNDSPYPATATIAGVIPGVDDTPGSSLEGVPVTITYFANGSTTPLSGAPTTAGAYNLVASFNGSQDYLDFAKQIFFRIAQDTPVLTASAAGGPYVDAPYPATATIAGVIPGVDDTPGSTLEGVPLTFTYYTNGSTTPLSGAPTSPGQYNVVVSFNGSQDYLDAAKQVLFQITPARPVLTASDAGGPYVDAPYPATATIAGVIPGVDDTPGSSLEGVPITFTYYTNGSTTPLSGAPTSPGQYNVLAVFDGSQDYFSAVKQIFFQITPALPVLTASDGGGSYTDAPYPATATIAGVISGVDNTPGSSLEGVPLTFAYYANPSTTPLTGAPTAAGFYNVVVSFNGSQDYFALSKQVFFQITQDQPAISLSDAGGTYNANPFPAAATIAGVVSGVDNTPGSSLEGVPLSLSYFLGTSTTGTPLSGVPTNAGQYTAVASFAGSTDYNQQSQSVTFTISQAMPTVVAVDAGGNFTGNPYPATATATGVGNAIVSGSFAFTYYVGSTVNGNGSTTAPTAPGTYTVVAGFTSSDANYVTGPTSSLPVVFAINPLPAINAPANVSVNQNGSLAFTAPNSISVTDAAGSGNNSETLTLGVANGTLTFETTTGLTIGGNGTGSVTASGPLASLNSDLATLVYAPTSGFNGSDTLNLAILDTTDQAQGSPAKVAIVVNPLSAPPSITAPATASVAENTFLVFSSANKNAITVTDASAGSNLEQLTLSVTHGTIKLGSTTGLTFVTGSNNSASMTIKGTLANLNADLNGLTFTPTVGYFGPASLSVTFTDLVSNQTASASVVISVTAPASTVTVSIKTLLPFAVPFEPAPFLIVATDSNASAQAAPFTININWGDGNTANLSCKSPLLLAHMFTRPGTYTVTVTATDEFGHTSVPATVTIRVLFVFIGINPFNPHQSALFVGGTGGNDTVSFTTAAGGIAVTLNGVAQGVFSTNGPLIVFTGGATDTVTKGAGVTASLYVAQNPTDYNLEADLEALTNGGASFNPNAFNAAMEVLGY